MRHDDPLDAPNALKETMSQGSITAKLLEMPKLDTPGGFLFVNWARSSGVKPAS
jgi:hypothetical protein